MSLAEEADATLTVMHAIDLLPDVPDMPGVPIHITGQSTHYLSLLEQDRRGRLERAVPGSVRDCCTVETLLVNGTPYREILRVAASQSSDLIVLGVHGRGPVDRLFFGSTTQHVVRGAACPVLTLRTS